MAAPRGRTICLIDNSYIFRGSYKHQWRVDFRKLTEVLARLGAIWQTYFFASEEDPPNSDQTNLYKYLKLALHFEVRLYPLRKRQMRCNACGNEWSSYSEKAAAIGMASELVSLAYNNAFDTAILVTGDSDFLDPIKTVKSLGKRIELAAWRDSIAQDLEMEASIDIFYLDEHRDELERPMSGASSENENHHPHAMPLDYNLEADADKVEF
ncbi:MAG: NYN domain-containing protein [bacterium]